MVRKKHIVQLFVLLGATGLLATLIIPSFASSTNTEFVSKKGDTQLFGYREPSNVGQFDDATWLSCLYSMNWTPSKPPPANVRPPRIYLDYVNTDCYLASWYVDRAFGDAYSYTYLKRGTMYPLGHPTSFVQFDTHIGRRGPHHVQYFERGEIRVYRKSIFNAVFGGNSDSAQARIIYYNRNSLSDIVTVKVDFH